MSMLEKMNVVDYGEQGPSCDELMVQYILNNVHPSCYQGQGEHSIRNEEPARGQLCKRET